MAHDEIVSGVFEVRQEARIGSAIKEAERNRLIALTVSNQVLNNDLAGKMKLGPKVRLCRRRYGQ
jgi:hypothetical protein